MSKLNDFHDADQSDSLCLTNKPMYWTEQKGSSKIPTCSRIEVVESANKRYIDMYCIIFYTSYILVLNPTSLFKTVTLATVMISSATIQATPSFVRMLPFQWL